MKKSICFFKAILFLFPAIANTYYSTNWASPNLTSSWHTNRNGTGSTPGNFTSGDIFVVQANHYLTTTANWTVNGTNSKIIVENGATLEADDKITVPAFEIYDGGTYIHNVSSNSFPGTTTRTFGSSSNVIIDDWSGSAELPSPTTWGNLTLNVDPSYNSNWNQAGDLTDIAGDFTIISTGNSSKEFRLATNQDYTLTIGGDFNIQGGNVEASSSNANADQLIIIKGSFNQSGGSFTRSNNNSNALDIEFNGSNSYFAKSSGSLTTTYISWIVNTGAKLTLSNNLPVALSRTLTVNGTLDCGSNQISGLGAFVLNSAGKMITSSSGGLNSVLSLTGLLTLTSGASYEFQTANTTPFPLLAGSISASSIIIDDNVTLNKDVTVSGTLTLNNGKLTIPAGNTLNITSGNAVSGSGFGNSKHIATLVNTITGAKGVLRIGGFSGTKLFPVGNGTYYMPVTLIPSGSSDFSVSVFQGATKSGTPNGTAFNATAKKTMVDAIWVVNRNSGSSSTNMQLAWSQSLEGSDFQSYADNQIGISHYDGTNWDAAFGTGSQSGNTATRTNILSFSPFGVGKGGVPLPIQFGDISLSEGNGFIKINWSSLTENSLDHYEVEKSADGSQFTTAGSISVLNPNSTGAHYTWTDMNAAGNTVLFYRIKAVDIDGKFIYSTILRISLKKEPAALTLYPNPVIGNSISFYFSDLDKGSYDLLINDMTGRNVLKNNFEHAGGAFSQTLQLPSTLKPGIYSLQVGNHNSKMVTKSFIVQ